MQNQSPELVFAVSKQRGDKQSSPYYLVKLKNSVKKSKLASDKLEIVRYLDHDYAIIRSHDLLITGGDAMFESISHANDLWKLSEKLLRRNFSTTDVFTIRVTESKLPLVKEKILSKLGVSLLKAGGNVMTIRCSKKFIYDHVLGIVDVLYIGDENHTPKTESRVLDLNLEPNSVARIHHEFPELNGEGTTISIKENLYNADDIDIDGRHISSSISATEIDNHSTDMATIAAGAGNSFVTGRGVAKAAHLTSSDFSDLFPDADVNYQTTNAWVQNHSYGTVIENFYGALAEAFDLSANRNTHLLHVFSSGNKGNETGLSGPYQGIPAMANITGNFKMSKNALVVGSVDTVGREVVFSSRGPAFDGRIKPEIVSYSTAGSSNSAALVSGIVSLLQQAYKEETGDLPPSALLKAVLINSATDAGQEGVDFVTGYGSMDGYRSVQNLISGRYFTGNVNQGETDNIMLSIPVNVRHLKITIVWNDPAAPVNSTKALINDIDLKVVDPSSNEWLPWVLDHSPDISKLRMQATRKVDHLNNLEQVTVELPQSGNYTLSVHGFDIPDGPQEYFIAYQWDIAEQFEWSFPTGSDNMPYNGESGSYFRWKSTLNNGTGTLQYSIDEGDTWITIKANVDLSKGYYRWLPPEINSRAIARMVIGMNEYLTDQFVISRPMQLLVGFNCSDSVMLQWNPVSTATDYEVLTFNQSYLESLQITADTSVILNKNEFSSKLYAVRPRLQGSKPGIQSFTYDYEDQGVECFVQNFYSLEEGLSGIRLTLQLGTTYGVEEIFFERESDGEFEVLDSADPISNSIEYLDLNPHQGFNHYRARIVLQNEEEIVTDITENFFLSNKPYAVFPNPVKRSMGLTVNAAVDQNTNGILRLYKSDGTLTLAYELISDREVIDLHAINPGLYFYSIEGNGQSVNGRILVIDQ